MEITDKIQKLFTQHDRRLVFYFDDDGSLIEDLEVIRQQGIKIIEVKQNYFELKYLLEFELGNEQVFVYHPFAKPSDKDLKKYPLLDLLKANVELRLDDASEFLTEYRLQEHQLPLVKKYIKQLKVKTNQKKLARILDPAHFTEENLKWGLISIALDFNTVTERNICVARWVSLAMDDKEFQRTNTLLASLDVDSELRLWINNFFDTKRMALDKDFAREVAEKIKYNILTVFVDAPVKEDTYIRLKLSRTADLNRLQAFFNDWVAHPTLKRTIEPVFEQLASIVKSATIITWYGSSQQYGYYSQEMITGVISDLYKQTTLNPLKTRDDCQRWLRQVSLSDDHTLQVEFLMHTSQVLLLLGAHPHFTFNKPQDYITKYVSELYGVDLHFRKAVLAYEGVRDRLYEMDQQASSVFNTLNERYDRYLIDLNVGWQKLLSEKDFKLKDVPVKKQFDFYKDNIQKFEYKIVVIISDALRYELGRELYDDLITDSKNTVSIEPCMASIPTYTNLGMTNLLPYSSVTVEKAEADLAFRIDGISTVSTNRSAILKKAESESDAITFSQAMKLNQESGRKFFSDNRIVYVYHDWIDAVGDKKRTEHQSFEATSKALDDIKRLIKKLNGWNVYHVLVTSDHGFLFNHTTIPESCRENLPKTIGYVKENSRFVVADGFEGKVDGYVMNLKDTANVDTDMKVAIPRAVNRYRKQGNIGLQFTHGGASLQELLTPLVKIYRQKKEFGQSVTFKRIDDTKRITSGSIKITLLQDQPVSNEYKSREVIIGLYSDTGEQYSAETTIILNSSSLSPKDRIYEPILSLNAKGTKSNYCYLKAFDKEDKGRLNPLRVNDLLQISSIMEKDEF